MPRIAYSEEDRERIRTELITVGLELMAQQGMQRTTVQQIYERVGISRTFFYSFFPTKEDLIVEALYLQQPRILAYARQLMEQPSLSCQDAVSSCIPVVMGSATVLPSCLSKISSFSSGICQKKATHGSGTDSLPFLAGSWNVSASRQTRPGSVCSSISALPS